MARRLFLLYSVLSVACVLLPLVAARPGGRSCHTSFFFPDLNSVRTFTLLRNGDGGDNADGDSSFFSGRFRFFSVTASKTSSAGDSGKLFTQIEYRFPTDLIQDIAMEGENADRIQTWSFSTSKPGRWVSVKSRRGMWHHDFANPVQQGAHPHWYPEDDAWVSQFNEVWRVLFGMLLGAVAGMVVGLAASSIYYCIKFLVQRTCMASSHEEEDVGFLYGYQELPSPTSAEKEAAQNEFRKEHAVQAESM